VTKAAGAYNANAAIGAAERFRMQATDLGKYLFYGPAPDFMARNLLDAVAPAAQPSDDADWTISEDGSAFRFVTETSGRALATGVAGTVTTTAANAGGAAGLFTFDAVSGCADYPEIEVNVDGVPPTSDPGDEVRGTVEGHMHQMAFEFLGTKAHCGRPWHRFGAPYALQDCVDHGDTNDPSTEGCAAVLENAVSGTRCHDTGGWPTFAGWPQHYQLTHEQSYYKWLERSWRSGTRIFVNLLVENRVLCEVYPLTPPTHDCDEMESVRREALRMRELERYIDAQSGGPGEGWYRIVESPAEARQVIADGKLAVVMGMEVSEPFGCRIFEPTMSATCDEADIDAGLDEIYDLGVRQLELVNKFDNALSGIAGDGGTTGTLTNTGNWLSTTGRFWDLEACEDPDNSDHTPTALEHNDDALIANGLEAFPTGGPPVPAYGPPPHCNQLGLSQLGERAIRRIMEKKMIFDPDHMSVIARNQALDLVETQDYPGLISSHSWSTPNATPRILGAGGLITPYAGSSASFAQKWADIKSLGYDQLTPFFGFGYGADMNGLGSQGAPRGAGVPNPVTYPFQSPIYPNVTVHQQVSGERTFDINTDGVAHYGLFADWMQDLKMIAGQAIVDDMARGAEAYLQTWERATGAREPVQGGPGSPTTGAPGPGGSGAPTTGGGSNPTACRTWPGRIKAGGITPRLRLGLDSAQTLARAGEPDSRLSAWRWCGLDRKRLPRKAKNVKRPKSAPTARRPVVAVFDANDRIVLGLSALRNHTARGIGPGTKLRTLRERKATRLIGNVWVGEAGAGRRFVYVVGRGRVRYAGVAEASLREPGSLRAAVRRSGLV